MVFLQSLSNVVPALHVGVDRPSTSYVVEKSRPMTHLLSRGL